MIISFGKFNCFLKKNHVNWEFQICTKSCGRPPIF
jgi:hypothetical protein